MTLALCVVVSVESGSSCVVDVGPVQSGSAGLNGSAPPGNWQNVTHELAGLASECGNLAGVFAKPDEDRMIAGVATVGLFSSTDGGNSWQALGTGPGSAMIANHALSLVFDPSDSSRYWEAGSYGAGAVFETTDNGNTFVGLGTVHHMESVSVDLKDPNRQTLVTGGHESSQTVMRSTNGGGDWVSVGAGLPVQTNCAWPLVIDAQTHLVGCGGLGGGPSGIYRTTDGGMTWKQVTPSGGSGAPLRASDGSIYWASPAQGGTSGGLTRSTDDGVTWAAPVGAGIVGVFHPVELPDGSLASLGSQYVVVSSNKGATWRFGSAPLPFSDGTGIAYSAQRKAFYTWHFTCGTGNIPVPTDAVMRFDFDYSKN